MINLVNKFTKNFLLTFLFVCFFVPLAVGAQGGIIPDCASQSPDPNPDCGFLDLIVLMNNVIDFLTTLALPISAIVFAWSGFELMTTGVVDQKNQAKERIKKVFIGLLIVLSAWIVTNTLAKALIKNSIGINTFIGN